MTAYRSGGLLGHASNRWIGNMWCGWSRFPEIEINSMRQLPFDLTQHPRSLYCTLKKETTASALFSPAVGLSITCMKDMRYRSIGSDFGWYAALWVQARRPYLIFQPALRAGAFSEACGKEMGKI